MEETAPGLELLYYPHPLLRAPARPVGPVTPEIARLARDMGALMRERKGIGLAAPQVGRSLRMVVVNLGAPGETDRVFVDPRIDARRGTETGEEGCLSFPGLVVPIPRSAWVRVSASDADGKPVTVEAEGLFARVLQHEIDHLDGILLTDRMSPVDRRVHRGLLRDLEEKFASAGA